MAVCLGDRTLYSVSSLSASLAAALEDEVVVRRRVLEDEAAARRISNCTRRSKLAEESMAAELRMAKHQLEPSGKRAKTNQGYVKWVLGIEAYQALTSSGYAFHFERRRQSG